MSSTPKTTSPDSPLVSIVTPVFNTGAFLERSLDSVRGQTFENWEMILIDDCSTDNSREILKKYAAGDPRFVLIFNEQNSGSGVSRNSGISAARGRYLCFLDSDDVWMENKLEVQLEFMKKEDVAFSFGSYDFIDESGKKIKAPKIVTQQTIDYDFLLKRTEIFTSTVMLDLEKVGKVFMPSHRRKQDYGLWLKILKSGVQAKGLQTILAQYRLRKGSATSNKWSLISKHVVFLRETQRFGWIKATYYTGYWAFNGIIKYYLR